MSKQLILKGESCYRQLEDYLVKKKYKKIMLVCGKSLFSTNAGLFFNELTQRCGIEIIQFSGFSPNPDYTDVKNGVSLFREQKCDAVCGAGGGSAMDTAKCIKLFAKMSDNAEYLDQKIIPNDIPVIAIPTTAGTGSEATRFAIIYNNGVKISVTDESCIPDTVLFDPDLLSTLPDLHRNSAMLDALCHAIESFWSSRSRIESIDYSRKAICMIMNNMEGYINHDSRCSPAMLEAANLAGKAINITTTTAAHAMCYKLTKLYGIPHGNAVALCIPEVYRFLYMNKDRCTDHRGASHLSFILEEIPELLGCSDFITTYEFLKDLPEKLGLQTAQTNSASEIDLLTKSVNIERLSNSPVIPNSNEIREMYLRILGKGDKTC